MCCFTEYDTTSTDSSQGDSPVRPPVSKLFTSSPSLSQSNSLSVVIPGHHRRSSSGDKIKVQLSMDLKQQIDSKLPRTGPVFCELGRETGRKKTHRFCWAVITSYDNANEGKTNFKIDKWYNTSRRFTVSEHTVCSFTSL